MTTKAVSPELVVLGHILFVLHTFARWNDLPALDAPPKINDILVEAQSKRTKVSRGLKRLRVPLPYAALCSGVSGSPWANNWVRARELFTLTAGPSILSVSQDGFGKGPMSSTEACRHLRALLFEAGTPPVPGQRLGSHSLKATILAWAARYPIKASLRRVIGKHSDHKDHSMLIYSRDTCIAGLQAVTEMFSAIINGEFDPDATRALIVAKRMAADAPDVEPHVETKDHQDAPAAETDESESSETSAERSDVDLCENMWKAGELGQCEEGDYLVNTRSGCMHVAAGSDTTCCGIMTPGLDPFGDYQAAFMASSSMCKKCFKAHA
eukprot:6461920-Amphidinium_carterae.2